MQTLQGIAVSPGVAIGEAFIVDTAGIQIARRFIARGTAGQELERLAGAFRTTEEELEHHRAAIGDQLGQQYAAIFSAHIQIVQDPQLRREVESLIRERNYSAEYAVNRSLRRYANILEGLDSSRWSERANDVTDIKDRILSHLVGNREDVLSELRSPVIVLAHDLTPSQASQLDPQHVLALVCETGGAGGHTAIMARAMGIACVMGVGSCLGDVAAGENVIVDGDHGFCYLQPDAATLDRFAREVEQHAELATELSELRALPAETIEGETISLCANIEFPREVAACRERGADGIGLYRTEFLYLGSREEPTEEDHYRAYCEVVESMEDRPVTIRTLDLGADKMGHGAMVSEEERNPFLGLRSIRLALRHRPLFRTQLRAILRASRCGDIRVMFPLISTVTELRHAKAVLADVVEDLEEEGIPVSGSVPVGMMVEVPSAVMMLDRLLPEVDFISIGTNDLIQYALAVDRGNGEVANLYTPSDPAVLRLVKMTIDQANQHGVPVAMCGQMSGSPLYVPLLIGMGLRVLSVPPMALPEIKSVCRAVSVDDCRAIAAKASEMDNAQEVTDFLREELRRVVPRLVSD